MRSSSCDSLTPWGLYNTCQRATQLLFLQIRKPFLTKLSLNLASGMNHGALTPQILDLQCASGAVLEVGLDRSRENGLAVSFERTADRFNTSHCVTVSNKGYRELRVSQRQSLMVLTLDLATVKAVTYFSKSPFSPPADE